MPAPTFTPLPTPPSRSNPATFSDDADAFLGAFPLFQTEGDALAAFCEEKAQEVADLVENAGFAGSSTTSMEVGTGTKTFTIQTGRAFLPGAYVLIADTAAPTTNSMSGQVTAYNADTGSMTVLVGTSKGAGTHTDWTITLSGAPGSDANVTKGNVEAAVGGAVALLSDVFVTITGTTHTLSAADNGKVHRFTSSSAVTVTLPNDLPVGWNAVWRQVGAGQITFAPASGASLRNRLGNTKSGGLYAEGALAVDTNSDGASAIYFLSGDTLS